MAFPKIVYSPLVTPAAPVLTYVSGGSIAQTTYYVKVTLVNAVGETTASLETSITVPANFLLLVYAPNAGPSGNATGWNVYVSTASGAETKQNGGTPIAIGTNWTEPTTGLVSGAAPPGSNGTTTTLTFGQPARFQPAYWSLATRHDNIASSGVRESILERTDQFLEIDLEWVMSGTDIQNWNTFLSYALVGGQFAYYPDSSLGGNTNYWLEDVEWKAAYKSLGRYAFKLKFRQVVV